MIDDDNLFGLQLRSVREERGLSQIEMAADLNTSPWRISEWENGKRDLTLTTLRGIANALGVPVARLLEEGHR